MSKTMFIINVLPNDRQNKSHVGLYCIVYVLN